jgi:hypothetical protein
MKSQRQMISLKVARSYSEVNECFGVMGVEVRDDQPVSQFLDVFYRIARLIPAGQDLKFVEPTTTVVDALSIMRINDYDQIPVLANGKVIGVFGYKSFADQLFRLKLAPHDLPDLTVALFLEKPEFRKMDGEFREILELLQRNRHFLVVDKNDGVQAIVTESDAIAFFNIIASPFILIQEAELALRELMRRAVTEDELAECARLALTQQATATGRPLPQSLEEMDLGNYLGIIRDTRNWPKFARTLGEPRLYAMQNIEALRSRRNDIMHFRGSISAEHYQELADCRNWLQLRMTISGDGR